MSASQYAIRTDHTDPATASPLRRYATLCIAGGVIAAIGAVWMANVHPVVASDRMSSPFSPSGFRATEVVWSLTHLLTFFGVLALVRSGVAGRGRSARVGGPLALVGMALLVPCELAFVLVANSSESAPLAQTIDTAIGISALLAGIGLTLLGIGVLRERRWQGWVRWTPIVSGLYEVVVLTALTPFNDTVFAYAIAGWNVCLVALGVALLVRTRP